MFQAPKLRRMDRHLNPDDFCKIQEVTLEEYNFIQAKHILVHKWYLSEEQHREVSFNEAAQDWIISDLAKEFRSFFTLRSQTKYHKEQ